MIHNSHVVCITMTTTQCKADKEKTNVTNHLVYRIGFALLHGSGIGPERPDVDHLVPAGAGKQPVDKDAHVDSGDELGVVVVPGEQRVLGAVVPHADGHVVGAGHEHALAVRREADALDSVAVSGELRDGRPRRAHVPDADGFVDGGGGEDGRVVLVPVEREHLVVVRGQDERGRRIANVPDPRGAVAGGGGEDVRVARGPGGGVDAVLVAAEGADGGLAVGGPELERVVPGRGDEGVPADGVPVEAVDLARVLPEEAHGVLRRRERGVEEAHGAVPGRGGAEGLVGLGPGAVEERVGGREGEDGGRGGAGTRAGGGEVEDDEVAVADEAKVLRRRDEEAVLVERAEADGEARRRGLERRHGGGGWVDRPADRERGTRVRLGFYFFSFFLFC
ncbi:hypothetical protein SEVIR_1G021000v4 [Setaria viridis]|uniref:Uncharacterized protein n=1 Tax=Setaria viridis TaxID=4556 RepID=A0A4U6W4N3_SETVI|nr:hypothetical protein SEVIR_1G021000v2 [Setaria viridis]